MYTISDILSGKPAVHRSKYWRSLSNRWLGEHPWCAACGSMANVVAHHIIPVHVDQSRELEWENLLTLCQNKTWNCHCKLGHGGDWRRWRPSVVELAAKVLAGLVEAPYVQYNLN